jgi:hypothetical protein
MTDNEIMEAKTDCFAYEKGSFLDSRYELCNALNNLYCRNGKCKFYKNIDEYKKNYVERKDMQYI